MNAAADRAILTRPLDLALSGGISIVAVVALLFLPLPPLGQLGAGATLILQAAINWPHFMGSYALLYSSRESVEKHRFAAIWVPLVLGAYTLFAFAAWKWQPVHVLVLQWVGAIYLARHYTGQTWGMMASFGFVEGVSFTATERWLIRAGLNLMMVWHMSWAAAGLSAAMSPDVAPTFQRIYLRVLPLIIVAAVVGAAGLVMVAVRLRRVPPARILVPWIAMYLWYALLAFDSSAVLIAQLSHALQYLAFPIRVETNRVQGSLPRIGLSRVALWIAFGFLVFAGLPGVFASVYKATGGHDQLGGLMVALVSSAVAIHHYFVDGVLYKLRNPDVRRAMFAHLPAPAR
jgi:hypothetical protein